MNWWGESLPLKAPPFTTSAEFDLNSVPFGFKLSHTQPNDSVSLTQGVPSRIDDGEGSTIIILAGLSRSHALVGHQLNLADGTK